MSILTHSSAIPLPYDGERAPDWFARKTRTARRIILNLAPVRYAFIAESGGPIEKIEYGHDEYLGQTWHLSRATLREDYRHPLGSSFRVFHPADGSGVGSTRLEARAKAISEALERWAYHETSAGSDHIMYGYQYAGGTKGMAAFPGVISRQARRLAMSEAFEYFTLDAWWNGALPHWAVERDNGTTVFIDQPHFKGFIALVLRHLDLEDYGVAYGIGSGGTPAQAELKAHTEAARMQVVLEQRDASPNRKAPVLEEEQLILSRASREGLAIIHDRLQSRPWRSAPRPTVIYDGPVDGPWNRYAHVWRYALEPLTLDNKLGRFAA